MNIDNLVIAVPVVALCCYMFLFFSFLNAKRTRSVYIFQLIIMSCLLWTVGSVLMYTQLRPGYEFWFQVALLGILLLPIMLYEFLFCILDIPKSGMLKCWIALTVLGVIANAVFGVLIEKPAMVTQADGSIVFVYEPKPSAYVLVLIEIIMLIYVTYVAHVKINGDNTLKKRLVPLLLGVLFIFLGVILEFVTSSAVKYDKIGGVIMALCMTYVMYREYSFEWSYRIKTGSIYMVALVFAALPVCYIGLRLEEFDWLPDGAVGNFVIISVGLMAWSIFVFWIAFKSAERMMEGNRLKKFEKVRNFQKETESLFSEDEIYDKVIGVLEQLKIDAEIYIFAKKQENASHYEIVRKSHTDKGLSAAEQHELILLAESQQSFERQDIVLLKYEDKLFGFIYLKVINELKMNYIEEECCQQIGAYAALCLKNASIYQEVYQMSIHDELTGLYNRPYYKDFMKKYWQKDGKQALIFMDIDDFKLFNELYGEKCGDDILRWCGVKMREVIGQEGATFRLGSNEFVIFTRCVDKDKLRILALQIQKRIGASDENKPKVTQPITLSIGIASYPEMYAATAEEQLKQAKRAAFFAKKNGKNRVEIFDDADIDLNSDVRDDKAYEQVAPTIYALTAAIDAKDSFTFEHSCHVSADAVLLAKEIGLNSNEVRTVKEAGLLHDIGKIGIPESILKKKGKLTNEEYEIMKTHVVNSTEMIHHLPNMDYVIPAVLAHHERYDGNGYPRGLKGEEIPLLGRILAVCDSYDAITSKRAYKEALSKEYAIAELQRNKGTQFDPVLVDAFIKLIHDGKMER